MMRGFLEHYTSEDNHRTEGVYLLPLASRAFLDLQKPDAVGRNWHCQIDRVDWSNFCERGGVMGDFTSPCRAFYYDH
jgi:hypothetical protein